MTDSPQAFALSVGSPEDKGGIGASKAKAVGHDAIERHIILAL
jgi:hypothetical protein